MSAGDSVRLRTDNLHAEHCAIQQVWIVKAVRSDSRAVWIQINDSAYASEVWHNALLYEVIEE